MTKKEVHNLLGNEIILYSETCATFFDNETKGLLFPLLLKECPVCGGINFKLLFVQNGFNQLLCRQCELVFTNPRLNDAGSKNWYNSDFYQNALLTEYRIVREVDKYYSSSTTNYGLMDLLCLKFLKYVPLNSNILDLGCGGGALLSILKDKYHYSHLKGVDLNSDAIEFGRKYRELDLENIDAKNLHESGNYDVVISVESIEHINEVNEFMLTVSSILKTGGLFFITTPHNDPQIRRFFGNHSDAYMPPNHINHFNTKNIGILLEKYGFKVIESETIKIKQSIFGIMKQFFYNIEHVSYSPCYSGVSMFLYPKGKNARDIFLNNYSKNVYRVEKGKDLPKTVGRIERPTVYKKIANLLSIKAHKHMIIVDKKIEHLK